MRPVDRAIVELALPALGALVAEPLFLLADSAIVGHLGRAPLAGLGIAGTLVATTLSLSVFLAYGTTAAVARRTGAGDLAGAIRHGVHGGWLAVCIGIAVVVVGEAAAGPLVGAFGPSLLVAQQAQRYLRIAVLGVPAMLVVLATTGVLRGLRDMRTPLVVAVAGFTANIALNLLLVYGVGLRIAGSALGTVIAQTAMAAGYVRVVLRAARREGVDVGPSTRGILSSLGAGVPLFLRTAAMRVVLVGAVVVAAGLGDAALAAYQVSSSIFFFLALALDAVAIAGQTLVGGLLGAGDVAGARSLTARMVGWGVLSGAVIGVGLAAARPLYVPLFTRDVAVRALLSSTVLVVAAVQLPAGPVFAMDGVLIGAGDGRFLAASAVLSAAVFVVAAWGSGRLQLGLAGLWWAMGAWLVARLLLLGWRLRGNAWAVTGAT